MQITINAPDNLPQAFIQQQIKELEDRLKQQANRLIISNKEQKYQAIIKISKQCASLPVLDHRTPDEILGYDQSPMGLWGDD